MSRPKNSPLTRPGPSLSAPHPTPRPSWQAEIEVLEGGWESVAGVDEAGRGPLAGPVVAAAVVLPRGVEIAGLRDSKLLSPPIREEVYLRVLEVAVCWSAALVEADEIDRINILQATHRAMAQALSLLAPAPHGALVDGLPVRGLPVPHRAIVGGDGTCVSIAAASVIAKVTRDRVMLDWDRRHPEYGFARHKGYGTQEHRKALRALGPCPCHRRSFRWEAS